MEGVVFMPQTVSVIIPTYRREQPLMRALVSVCEQDYPCTEIIIVDDNAHSEWNARVARIIDEVQKNQTGNTNIRLIVNPQNMGAARSRNVGIQAAQGAYITFLDDDDLYLPSKISTQLAAMQAASADYSLMDLDLFNDDGQLVEHKEHPYIKDFSNQKELIRLHLLHHLTGTDTMMFRKEYLSKIGGFGSIDVGDEFYLMMKAIEGNGRFLYLPQVMVHATVHYDGSGLSGGAQKFRGEELLFEFKKAYFPQLTISDIRYIRMRHHAVLAFAHLKVKAKLRFLMEAGVALCISPIDCIHMLYNRHHKRQKRTS